jgi:hypothetical protein
MDDLRASQIYKDLRKKEKYARQTIDTAGKIPFKFFKGDEPTTVSSKIQYKHFDAAEYQHKHIKSKK